MRISGAKSPWGDCFSDGCSSHQYKTFYSPALCRTNWAKFSTFEATLRFIICSEALSASRCALGKPAVKRASVGISIDRSNIDLEDSRIAHYKDMMHRGALVLKWLLFNFANGHFAKLISMQCRSAAKTLRYV